MVVVVRVEEGSDNTATMSNIIGGIDPDTAGREGMQALLDAESLLKVLRY